MITDTIYDTYVEYKYVANFITGNGYEFFEI
jgi:hypothetical protein